MFNPRSLFYVFFLLICTAHTWAQNPNAQGVKNMSQTIDTRNWQTHCIGRFLIDLPPNASNNLSGQVIAGDKITWEKNITSKKQLTAVVNSIEQNIKAGRRPDGRVRTPRLDGKSYFIKRIDYPNGGIGILEYATLSNNPTAFKLHNYFITEKPFRVFKYISNKSFYDDNFDKKIAFNQQLAKALQSREPQYIPTEPGLCIDGGFINGDLPLQEEVWQRFDYPYHSKDFYLLIALGTDIRDTPLTRPLRKDTLYPVKKGHKVLRDHYRTIEQLKGEEYLVKNAGHDDMPYGFTNYEFEWELKGIPNDAKNPHTLLSMRIRRYEPLKEKAAPSYLKFVNDETALAYWDLILNSVRQRPEK